MVNLLSRGGRETAADDAVETTEGGRVSLLWPPGQPPRPGPPRLDERTFIDLDLGEAIRVLSGSDPRREPFVTSILAELNADAAIIRYRQEVVHDLLEQAGLRERLSEVSAALGKLLQERGARQRAAWTVSQIARRVQELENYVDIAVQLRQALEEAPLRSTALQALRGHVLQLTQTSQFRTLQEELPVLRATLERVGSITIGVNLTRDLSPDSATVLSIDRQKVEGRMPLLERLFGNNDARGLTPLHVVELGKPGNPLYRDLLKLLEAAAGPVQDAIGRYTTLNAYWFTELEPELVFLLNAVALTQRFTAAGLPVCCPQPAPAEERISVLEDGYNVSLALRLTAPPVRARAQGTHQVAPVEESGGVVTNTMAFGEEAARIWILTGPNRGGKTTYTRAVGQAHVLFQAGLYVPARTARVSPVNAIYTHFATQETGEVGMGRLDEEAVRLAQIFRVATPHSLILLNEVLAGTSTIEALGLATDAVRGLRLLGARAIYTTHLHELAARVDEMNATTAGDAKVGSLVADVEAPPQDGEAVIGPRHRRTFRIVPSPPRNVSYASEIAEQHGISFDQLLHLFARRGLLPQAATADALPTAARRNDI